MEAYYNSPISTLPNEEVWKNYWTMGDYIIQGQLIDFSTVPLSKEFSVSMEEGVPVVSIMDKAY